MISARSFEYTNEEWRLIKLFTGIIWLLEICRVLLLNNYTTAPYPEGIFRLADLSFIGISPVKYILVVIAVAGVIMYVAEKRMLAALLLLSLISLAVFTLERSNSVKSRSELLSLILLVQLAAYAKERFFTKATTAHNTAMFYSIQMIAAAYVMSAISKLLTSGFDWIWQSQNFVVQITKISEQILIELQLDISSHTQWITGLLLAHPHVTHLFFAAALTVELFAFVACFSKTAAKRYGWALLALHLGMLLLIGIVIPVFVLLVLVYLLNISKPLLSGYSFLKSKF
ncbi:MAG: hypothetical protein KIS94_01310 [Chitinophagales bacterium]|nr:hypothetical protein [Chitinophagales bacterium]